MADEPGFHARRRADRQDKQDRLIHYTSAAVGPEGPVPGETSTHNRTMNPHLEIMCGPMLRYDTIADNTYHAFALVVTADAKSDYSTAPFLTLEWAHGATTNLAQELPAEGETNIHRSPSTKIYQYNGPDGSFTFWRFKIELALTQAEQEIFYSVNDGPEYSFFVPAAGANFRWIGYSCNGFSAGVDQASFNGPDPLWNDLLKKHEAKPYHALVGGGDQIYSDPLAREEEIAKWIEIQDPAEKIAYKVDDSFVTALDRFLFNNYCKWFRGGAFGRAIKRIPMLNMTDDHDLIDGFGSYPDDLMSSDAFSTIGSHGFFWYLLFQNFMLKSEPIYKSLVLGGDGPWIPYQSHSFLASLGPNQAILLLDCRAERKKNQICSQKTYDIVFRALEALPDSVKQVTILVGVPIAYPRMTLVENILSSKLVSMLSKSHLLPSFANKFNYEAELLDDLNDHWTAKEHKKERNALIVRCQKYAEAQHVRVTFLSGDVHATAVAELYTRTHKIQEHTGGAKGYKIEPAKDHRYMLNVISSAIVNTPPPAAVITLASRLGARKHKTLHYAQTDERLIPVYKTDTDGKTLKFGTVLGRRNYAEVNYKDDNSVDFTIFVEVSQGAGNTKGYTVNTPAPEF